MKILNAQEVKARIENDPSIKLVMTLGPSAFQKCHIPGSINIWDMEDAIRQIGREDQVIVYCSDVTCMASFQAYKQLEASGYTNVWRFAGGLVEWSAAGYPLNEQNEIH